MCLTIFLNIIAFQFFIISVSCFVGFFGGYLKIIVPGVGFSTIFLPHGSGFRTFFVTGEWGVRPLKKFPGVCRGDGQAWN